MGRLVPYLAIAALTGVLMIPALLSPPMLHQSFWIDWVWADQFTAELGRGVIYPRWLPLAHGGLGSPVFYFYPPLSFFLAGGFGLAGLSTYASILAAFAAAIAASGFAMYHWLKGWTGYPFAGALFFMAAPYHVLDFYGRGALAESVGIAILPLIALGLKRAHERRDYVLPSLAFAGLIFSHLPLAVLAIVFLIVPHALFLARRDWKQFLRLLLPFPIGAAIAGIYLVPALMLDRHRAAEHLWTLPYLRTDYWNVFTFDWSALEIFGGLVFATMFAIAVAGLIIFAWARSAWAAWAVVVCLVAAGFLAGFWSLPIIEKVQFSYRALSLAEFALATALALVPRRAIGIALLSLIPALLISALATQPSIHPGTAPMKLLASRHPDVLEYAPPGATQPGWTTAWNFVVADHLPQPRTDMTVERTFYFPSWEVKCAGRQVETFRNPDTGLLSYRGDRCERRLMATREERIGQALSLLGLLVLALFRWRKA